MTYSPLNVDDASRFRPLDPWDRTPSQYAPTPGRFGRTPTPSVFCPSPDCTPDERSTPLQQPQPDQLGLLQLADWEEGRPYAEQPPTCIHYLIEWRVTLNNRVVAKNTEQDLVLTPSAYWQLFLKQQPEDILRKKISHTRRVRADDTTIVVSVNDRSQRDLTKRFDKTDIDWTAVEKQLLMWGNLFLLGKELRLKISINYIEDSNRTSSRKNDKRGSTSVTQRMLADREAQIDAEQHVSGQPSAWRDVYRMMRCPGPPCPMGASFNVH